MRFFLIFIIIISTLSPCNAAGFLQKKDYKQIFIQDALKAEKRNNNDSAFHSYEKALYYYKKDKTVLEAYAGFCERKKYFKKAEELYQKLYDVTKDSKYLYKKDLSTIKNGNLTESQLRKMAKEHVRTQAEQKDISVALIYYYAYKQEWKNAKEACAGIDRNLLGKDVITDCIVAAEKTKDKKVAYSYLQRYNDLYPDNLETIKRIITLAGEYKDYQIEEIFVKELSGINPSDNGIKYQLAGVYQKYGDWKKANKVYEALMASGDKSKYVKESYAYTLAQSKKPPGEQAKGVQNGPIKKGTTEEYKHDAPKPLTQRQLREKAMYEALDKKDFKKVASDLDSLLRGSPKDTKLLKLRTDMAMAQDDYPNAIIFYEKLKKINFPLSLKDEKLLAFSYSKTGNKQKALEITENLLQKNPEDKELLNSVLEYSLSEGTEGQNTEKAQSYLNKLLVLEPNSEKLLKTQGDLFAKNKDFSNAVISYEKLIQNYPTAEYMVALSNLYMANQQFANAQAILEPLYNANPGNPEIVDKYLNTLMAQQKLCQAYWVVKNHHLENTKNGNVVLGDMAMKDKNYKLAEGYYSNALQIDPVDINLKNKLAGADRMLGYINGPTRIYNEVLAQDPCNLDARLGLGYLEIDKKNYSKAREIFLSMLRENLDYRPAKIGVANSYIANDDTFQALEALRAMPADEESNLMQAKLLYSFGQYTDHFKLLPNPFNPEVIAPIEPNLIGNHNYLLSGAVSEEARVLKDKIRRDNAVIVVPTYSFFFQQLSDAFKLDYHKFGIQMSQQTQGNRNTFMEYNNIIYSSGGLNQQNNVVNEFRAGTIARPSEKWEYRADMGVKSFEFGNGAMLIMDSWIKHYFNDKYSLKLGYRRNNIEQSYLSAVGRPIDGVFTGRAADNKVYLEGKVKLPNQYYAYAMGSYGAIYAQNLITNMYYEALAGVGKLFYYKPDGDWIHLFSADLISYNSSYQYNLLNIYSSTGELFGGYFSPSFFNADTINLRVEGKIKNTHLNWGLKVFGGIQTAITPEKCTPTWGISPYISYHLNDKVSINAIYNHFTYADLVRDQFIINAVFRGYNNGKK